MKLEVGVVVLMVFGYVVEISLQFFGCGFCIAVMENVNVVRG